MFAKLSDLESLASRPEVEYVSPNRSVDGAASVNLNSSSVLRLVGYGSGARPGWKGNGVGVAIIDSGIDRLTTLRNSSCQTSRIVYDQNFVAGEATTDDLYGHGTHVASILGGTGKCEGTAEVTSLTGLAPEVSLVNLRVLDKNGRGTDSAILAAIDKAIALKSQYNIKVINMSLGRAVKEALPKTRCARLWRRPGKRASWWWWPPATTGATTAWGTSGYGTISSPGNDPYDVITVGALRAQAVDRTAASAATYSSKGPTLYDRVVKPDLLAPGNLVLAPMPGPSKLVKTYTSNVVSTSARDLFKLSGTSMATPVVSAAAALLLDKDESLTPNQIKARLMKTAWKGLPSTARVVDAVTGQSFNIQHDIFTEGAGVLDLEDALASSEKASSSKLALSPRATMVSGKVRFTKTYTTITGVNVIWGDNVDLGGCQRVCRSRVYPGRPLSGRPWLRAKRPVEDDRPLPAPGVSPSSTTGVRASTPSESSPDRQQIAPRMSRPATAPRPAPESRYRPRTRPSPPRRPSASPA